MQQANLFLVFLKILNKGNIEYMVTGSIASIIYGEPRVTYDIDLVLQLQTNNIPKLIKLFPTEEFYCPPLKTIETEAVRKNGGRFNIIHHKTGFKADIYPAGEDQLHKWAMSRRKKVEIEGCQVWLAPPEYVIIRKLEYLKEGGSEKHLRDIKRMLEISGPAINTDELKQKMKERGLINEWEKVLK